MHEQAAVRRHRSRALRGGGARRPAAARDFDRGPELAPGDDDDLDDESESWRDRLVNNQTGPIDRLLALVEQHRELVAQVRAISGSDLGGAASIRNLEPLFEIASLREVIGELPEAIAAQLRRRNVEIKQWQPR